MRLKITYTTDPTGMTPDITTVITILRDTCLFCFHDKEINRVEEIIKSHLVMRNIISTTDNFTLFKVHTI